MEKLLNLNWAELGVIFTAGAIAITSILRIVGEFLIMIGNLNPKVTKIDTIGAKIIKLVTGLGKVLAFLGIGNKQK